MTVGQVNVTVYGISSNGMALGRDGIGLSCEGTQWNGLSTMLDNTLMGWGYTGIGYHGTGWVCSQEDILTFTVMI